MAFMDGREARGAWPELTAAALDDGALADITDHRDVAGVVLQ